MWRGEERVFTPEQVLATFMTQLKVMSENNLKKPVVDVVVSVRIVAHTAWIASV